MTGFTAADFDRVRAAARDTLAVHQLPGLCIGIVRGNDLVFAESFGCAQIESKQPMDLTRRQCIASITKTMVGLCTMALVDEGRLRLDDRVVDLLPEIELLPTIELLPAIGRDGPAQTMTIWHLLTHTAGIGEAPTQDMLAAAINPDAAARREPGSFATLYEHGIAIEYEPGTKWHYANHGFNLLGEIIQRSEKSELADVMQRRIFGPLGMTDTDLLGESHPRLATPYHRAPSEDTRAQLTRAGIPIPDEATIDGLNIRGSFGGELNKAALAAGGVQSTIPDMARYASALLRRGGGIVRPETFAAMIAPQYCPNPRMTHWGLSLARVPFGERVLIGHGGAYFGGWNSSLEILPGENLAVLQHMNVMLANPRPAFDHVMRAVLDVQPAAVAECAIDARILETAPGTYELTPGRLSNFRPATGIGRIQIERDGQALHLRSRWGAWKSGVRMIACDDSDRSFFALKAEDGEVSHVALTRDSAGGVTGLRCDRLVQMVRKAAS